MLGVAQAQTIAPSAALHEPVDVHREPVDVSQYPWSAIGKLYNETGAACTAAIIASDKVLTAAHCIYNYRTHHFITADALHFLAGYHVGKYTAHARVADYQVGAGFDPMRYNATSSDDWAILTLAAPLPAEIVPLKLSGELKPSGTKAVIAGYPEDRAFALTADADCEVREQIDDGKLFLHTCRGIAGYSGAPILVRSADNETEIAGIQIATLKGDGTEKVLAVPARTIEQALNVEHAPPGLFAGEAPMQFAGETLHFAGELPGLCALNNIAGDVVGLNAVG